MRLCALALAVLIAVACRDASAPSNGSNPTALALHMDSLYSQACAQAYSPDYEDPPYYSPYYGRCLMMSVLIAAPASGAEPSPLVVENSATDTNWRGVVINFVDTLSGGLARDSAFYLVAYSDQNVTSAIVAQVLAGNQSAYVVADDTVAADGYGTFTASTVSRGARCTDVQGVTNPPVTGVTFVQIQYSPTICQLGTFSVAWNGLFNVLAVDSVWGQATIPTQTVNGITVFNSPWGINIERVFRDMAARAIRRPRAIGATTLGAPDPRS